MGLLRVMGRLTGPTGRSEDAELLVDTGATLLVVPRSWAPSRSRAFSWRWILSRSA
jgi:predicted aspartyl protease